MSQGTWRLLAIGVVTIVAYLTLGWFLTLVSMVILSIVYVRFTPNSRFVRARTARSSFYAQLNPLKARLSSLKEAKETGNASRFYEIHQELVEDLQKTKEPSNNSVRVVNEYIAWHEKRYANSNDGQENSNAIVSDDRQDGKKNGFLQTLKELQEELSYETKVPSIDPIPLEEVVFFDIATSECRELFDDSLLDHEFALIYEQHKTRRSIEHTSQVMRNEVAVARSEAAAAKVASKKASRQARAAKRKANQNNPNAF
ncbi:MAG: hypothetical protein OXG25_10130 [Gammaproteobacteria bacterium]|nr:hypothetical protein [Gammaproteobacteria bacterium]